MDNKFLLDNKSYTKKDLVKLFENPFWYMKIGKVFQEFKVQYERTEDSLEKEKLSQERDDLVKFLGVLLKKGKVALGDTREFYFDYQRKPIDTIVIHHTSRESTTPIDFIEAMHLLNLYCTEFSNKNNEYFEKPIFSGHLRNGKQTFLAYHYLIWPNGKFEQMLKDEYIGWHCGNWEINCRSIAISFHDDLEEKEPTQKAIETAKNIIRRYKPKNILGHREIKPSTTCPGNKFLGEGGWKEKLFF